MAEADLAARTRQLEEMSRLAEEERAKLAAVLFSMNDALVVIDQAGRAVLGNELYTRTFGESFVPEDDVGNLLPPEAAPLARAARGETFQMGFSLSGEPRRHYEAASAPVRYKADGAAGAFLAVITLRDVTERKRIEEHSKVLLHSESALRAAAERANAAKDEFLATLSHELRTPLTSILGWVTMLQTHSLDAAIAKKGLAVIERNARAQTRLIEDLLDVSRIIAGKMKIEKQPLDFAEIVRDALESFKPVAEAKRIALSCGEMPAAVLLDGDAARLRQVAANLLSNAIKFTPAEGRVEAALRLEGSQASFTVADTGRGISRAFLPHIFRRFSQEDSSKSRSYMGLGLGLAIARSIVELHGGSISVHSEGEGKGAAFRIMLPILRSELPTPLPGAHRAVVCEGKLCGVRVLAVEDDGDVRELLLDVLKMAGAEVAASGSAEEALLVVRQFQPTVLLCDIGLPGDNGYVLLKKLREIEKAHGRQPVPALALTGCAQPEDAESSRAAGYQGHLTKPVAPDVLVSQIAALVS